MRSMLWQSRLNKGPSPANAATSTVQRPLSRFSPCSDSQTSTWLWSRTHSRVSTAFPNLVIRNHWLAHTMLLYKPLLHGHFARTHRAKLDSRRNWWDLLILSLSYLLAPYRTEEVSGQSLPRCFRHWRGIWIPILLPWLMFGSRFLWIFARQIWPSPCVCGSYTFRGMLLFCLGVSKLAHESE